MGQKTGRGKTIHEILVDVQLKIGNPVANPVDLGQSAGMGQYPCRALQGAVAQRFEAFGRQVREHADGHRRDRIDEDPEGAGHVKGWQFGQGQPHGPGNGLQDGVHGRLGANQAVQIGLADHQIQTPGRIARLDHHQVGNAVNVPQKPAATAGHEAAADVDHTGLEKHGGQIDEPGTADPPGAQRRRWYAR